MILKGIIDEDFVNYKIPCMTLEFPRCSFKCDKECGKPVCQNGALASSLDIQVDIESLIQRYLNNPITHAVVAQGLEPLDSWDDLLQFVTAFRKKSDDNIIIYTGYNKDEIGDKIMLLKAFPNIIVKFGRYIPGQQPHSDPVLGVDLASDNQYAEEVS